MIEVYDGTNYLPAIDADHSAERLQEIYGWTKPPSWLEDCNKITLNSGSTPSEAKILLLTEDAEAIADAQDNGASPFNILIRISNVADNVTKVLANFALVKTEAIDANDTTDAARICTFKDWRYRPYNDDVVTTTNYPKYNRLRGRTYDPVTTTYTDEWDPDTISGGTTPYTYGEVIDNIWGDLPTAPGLINAQVKLSGSSLSSVNPTNIEPEDSHQGFFNVFFRLIHECGLELFVDDTNEPRLFFLGEASLDGPPFLSLHKEDEDVHDFLPEKLDFKFLELGFLRDQDDYHDSWGEVCDADPFLKLEASLSTYNASLANEPRVTSAKADIFLATIDAVKNPGVYDATAANDTGITNVANNLTDKIGDSALLDHKTYTCSGLLYYVGTDNEQYTVTYQERGYIKGPIVKRIGDFPDPLEWFTVDVHTARRYERLRPERRFNMGIVYASSILPNELGEVEIAYADLTNDGGTAKHAWTAISPPKLIDVWNKTGSEMVQGQEVVLEYDWTIFQWFALPTGDTKPDELRAEFLKYYALNERGNPNWPIIQCKRAVPTPIPLPIGTPAINEDMLLLADIHGIGKNYQSGDWVRGIKNTAVETFTPQSGDPDIEDVTVDVPIDVNWECNLDDGRIYNIKLNGTKKSRSTSPVEVKILNDDLTDPLLDPLDCYDPQGEYSSGLKTDAYGLATFVKSHLGNRTQFQFIDLQSPALFICGELTEDMGNSASGKATATVTSFSAAIGTTKTQLAP